MSEKISLYMDEHIPRAVVEGLRRRGMDVLSTREAEMLGASDKEQLALAVSQDRVIFTQDDDFLRLHAKEVKHCGIVYTRQQTSIGEMLRGLMFICQVLDTDEMRNHVEFL